MKQTLILTLLAAALLTRANLLPAAPPKDPKQILAPTEKAYANGRENGNQAVRAIIERHPGNTQLALAGLNLILRHSDRNQEWTRYASSRLLALQELGLVSWYADPTPDIYLARISQDIAAGRRLSAKLLFNELSERYPEDVRSNRVGATLSQDGLSHLSAPPPTGSPLALLETIEFNDHWHQVPGADPAGIAETIDTIIGEATGKLADTKDWEGDVGNIEAWTAMDLHLRRQPAASLAALRAYQEKKLREDPDNLKLDALKVFRRFPWAETAHRRLLDYGGTDLGKGRLQAAYRSFDDVRTHSVNPEIRQRAAVGCLMALSSLGDAESLAAEFDALDAKAQLPWMGKSVSVAELRRQLQPAQKPTVKTPDLETLKIQTVVPPPIAPWRSSAEKPVSPELQVQDDHVVLSARWYLATYARNKTDRPKWLRKDEFNSGSLNSAPGSYAPALSDGRVYARNRSSETSAVMNVIDLASGSDLWSMGRYKSQQAGISPDAVPKLHHWQKFLSKPVFTDGSLIYLSYEEGVRNREKNYSVVAVDIETRRVLWRSPIKFRKAWSVPHVCGIPPIVHKGFVYAVTSSHAVSCHDLRDGRLVWVHKYSLKQKVWHDPLPRYAGSPVIVGNRLICSPLDNVASTIALDLDTGRLLWRTPYALVTEQVGRYGKTVLVRDELTLAALSIDDGKIRWSHRFEESIVGRTQLMGDRVYVSTESRIVALSAGDGTRIGQRKWALKDGAPQAVRIDGDSLFVVGNTPYLDPARRILNPNAPKAPAFKLPLRLAWTLPISKDTYLIKPPPGSPLAGKVYYQAADILTCAEANPQGGIVWQRFMRKLDNDKPIFFGELLVLRNAERQLIAFDGRTGERRWTRKVSGRSIHHAGDYIMAWDGSNSGGTVVCLDLKTGKIRWQKTFGHGCQAIAQAKVIHILQIPHGKHLRHLLINPLTGETIRAYEDIPLDIKGQWWTVRSCGAKGALFASSGKARKSEYVLYKMDGKKPRNLGDLGVVNIFVTNEKYAVCEVKGPQLAVYNFEDDGYRASPLPRTRYDRNNWSCELDGDRLICVQRGRRIVLFDLKARKVLHDSKKKDRWGGLATLLHEGNRLFVQMNAARGKQKQAPSYFIDLKTGGTTEAPGSILSPNIGWYYDRRIPRYSNGLLWIQRPSSRAQAGATLQFWSPKE
ncbi:MAG: PQQ-binding-like beta-propeller repeat protein [Phycisphaerales bacterium]|nr:PQQ-binding-like beta-propeller repeat protein [Phycisphaerales bacterium]